MSTLVPTDATVNMLGNWEVLYQSAPIEDAFREVLSAINSIFDSNMPLRNAVLARMYYQNGLHINHFEASACKAPSSLQKFGIYWRAFFKGRAPESLRLRITENILLERHFLIRTFLHRVLTKIEDEVCSGVAPEADVQPPLLSPRYVENTSEEFVEFLLQSGDVISQVKKEGDTDSDLEKYLHLIQMRLLHETILNNSHNPLFGAVLFRAGEILEDKFFRMQRDAVAPMDPLVLRASLLSARRAIEMFDNFHGE